MHFTQELAKTRFTPAFTPRQEYSSHSTQPSSVWTTASLRTRSLSGLVLAASLSAILIVAHQLINAWLDGDTLLAWMSLWMVVFVALALVAPVLRRLSARLVRSVAHALQARRQQDEEAYLWELAGHDPRILTEIRCARARAGE